MSAGRQRDGPSRDIRFSVRNPVKMRGPTAFQTEIQGRRGSQAGAMLVDMMVGNHASKVGCNINKV